VTDANIRSNVADELARAAEAERAFVLLLGGGLHSDAVSRLYYFLLHSVRALLLTKGLEPRSHEGALRLFAQHFVKGGLFPRGDSHLFSKMMKFREEADYNPAYSFSADDVALLHTEAKDLCDRISEYLKKF
jgi:hypothetical protein